MTFSSLNFRVIIILSCLIAVSFSSCGSLEKELSDTVEYDVVFRENLSGSYQKKQVGERKFEYFYTYADRGRGPKFNETITLNEDHFIIDQRIEGNNYRKVAINESFQSDESSANWENIMGKSDGKFKGDKLYFRYSGSPAIYEILAQLLLRSASNKVALYPVGEVELVKQIPQELSDGTSADLLVIKGLDLDPIYLWMKDGQMVAKIAGNLHIIRQDLSDLRLEMNGIQSDIEDESLTDVAKSLSEKIAKVVIGNVNVFQADGALLRGQDVIVEGEKIMAINPSQNRSVTGAKTIDGTGKTLLPGMFDMHTHNTKFRGILHLAGGVTSVRDLANNKQLKDLAKQFNDNDILGPRIVTYCGIIDGPGEFANQRNVVENLEEALFEIQDYKDLGYQQIKLYSSIKPEWVAPLTQKAHDLGMRVSGHIPAYMTATQAINQGYNEIQHINMLFLNFLSDTIDTRTPLRHTMPAQHGADLDLNSSEYTEFVQLLKAKDILVDPTAAIFENMYLAQKGEVSPTYASISERFPIMNQRSFYTGGLPKEGEKAARYSSSFDKMLDVIADLYQQGVVLVPGTDGLPGFLYHRELELYVKAGISAVDVLKLATITSAEITGVADNFGSIAVGKQADLILVDGNPLENISDIRKIEWTIKGGYFYDAEKLYESAGVKHFK